MSTPCLEWTASRDRDGYGYFGLSGNTVKAHRVAYAIKHGSTPGNMHVLHRCDNPPCVAIDHLFLGTNSVNVADKMAKGRQARGDRHGARLHPESHPRGDASWSRLHPEKIARGDSHYSRQHPELLAHGERNGAAKLNDESVKL